MIVMLFYLNVFYLPTLKDFVGLLSCGMRFGGRRGILNIEYRT